jgi:cold shock CspA family protein
MADVFVSYAQEDRAWVRQLVQALKQLGLSVWWDLQIAPGEHYDRVIERELDAAMCIVVVWSKASLDSDNVRNEAVVGRQKGRLVQVTIEGVSWPSTFAGWQTVDLTEWDGDAFDPDFLVFWRGVFRVVSANKEAPQERVKDLIRRYEALKASSPADDSEDEDCDPTRREPRASEVRLANCVHRYVQAWLADSELGKALNGRPPTMQQLLSPPKSVSIEVGQETVAAPAELARRMRWLYTKYAEHPELAKDGVYSCILPLINPDVRTNPAVTTLREVAGNLHRAFEPAAAPIRVAVHFVEGRPAPTGTHAQSAARVTGTVQSFDLLKGFGFITPDDGGKDIVVDMDAVKEAKIGPLEEGMRVTYDIKPDNRGRAPRAVRVRPR